MNKTLTQEKLAVMGEEAEAVMKRYNLTEDELIELCKNPKKAPTMHMFSDIMKLVSK